MAFAFVQKKYNSEETGTVGVTFDSLPTAGNIVIICTCTYGAGLSSLGDNQSGSPNTYSTAVEVNNGDRYIGIYYAENVTVNQGTFTVTLTTTNGGNINAAEFSGGLTSSAKDQSTSNNGSGTATTSGNVTTATDGELFIGMMAYTDDFVNETIAEDGSWTLLFEQEVFNPDLPQSAIYRIADSGTYGAAWTLGDSLTWIACVSSFKPAAATGASIPVIMHHMKQQGFS